MSKVKLPSYLHGRERLAWHRMKSAGKRYARWLIIRPHPDPIGDNSMPRLLGKTRAKGNNRSFKRQFGCEA